MKICCTGQVLPRPYQYDEGLLVFKEMTDLLCADLLAKNLMTPSLTWWVSYDPESLVVNPYYQGPLVLDYYGRLHPKHSKGTVKMRVRTNSKTLIMERLVPSFESKVDHQLLIRRLGIAANDVEYDDGCYQWGHAGSTQTVWHERSRKRHEPAGRRYHHRTKQPNRGAPRRFRTSNGKRYENACTDNERQKGRG